MTEPPSHAPAPPDDSGVGDTTEHGDALPSQPPTSEMPLSHDDSAASTAPTSTAPTNTAPTSTAPTSTAPTSTAPIDAAQSSDAATTPTDTLEPPAVLAPAVTQQPAWRFWPEHRVARAALLMWGALCVAYVVAVLAIRYSNIFDPYAIDGDQPQAVWHYWRYHIRGAFPPGHLMTDYAFVMHAPPVWWLLMATLSTFVTPILAAKLLNLVAVAFAALAMFFGVSKRSNAFVGFAAVVLMLRSIDFTAIIAGGYARSFGPGLTLAFLAAFMLKRHYWVLALLVLQAAFYPSVVMPCGIAYGLYTVVAGPSRARRQRMLGMFVAGLLVIAFGKFQDIAAPSWWGSVVTQEQALKMPSWGSGGRIHEAPIAPLKSQVPNNLARAFRASGHTAAPAVGQAILRQSGALMPAIVFGLMCVCGVWWGWRRYRGRPLVDPVPWQLVHTFAAAFLAYLLARHFAFKLYLPYRPLQHVWPYLIYAALPLACWCLFINLFRNRQALAVVATLACAVAAPVLVFGDGLAAGPPAYVSHQHYSKTYDFVQKLPIDTVIAGEFSLIDKTPLMAWHQSYVTRNLAHPFRPGYYAECEKRIVKMYNALYATSLQDVVKFAEDADVDVLLYRTRIFNVIDQQLFNPPRSLVAPAYKRGSKDGFALKQPPKEAILYQEGETLIVSVAKLKIAMMQPQPAPRSPALGPQQAPDAAFIGPRLQSGRQR